MYDFKPYDRVLVRDSNKYAWEPALYGYQEIVAGELQHFCIGGNFWNEAIPYEGNEDLVNTFKEPKVKI